MLLMMSYNAIGATATVLSYTKYLVTLQKNLVTEESSSFYEEELAANQIRKFVLLTQMCAGMMLAGAAEVNGN